jgi:hypothetical protein
MVAPFSKTVFYLETLWAIFLVLAVNPAQVRLFPSSKHPRFTRDQSVFEKIGSQNVNQG